MRNLEECQAEVFRRSEKRIKKRKQRRNRMLMACIPLALCITVLGVLLFPGATERTGNSCPPDAAAGALPEHQGESYVCSIAGITVVGHGFSRTVTNPADILRIWDQLYALRREAPENHGASDGGGIETPKANGDRFYSSVVDTDYRITLTMWEGEPSGYLLTDSSLKDLAAGKTYPLTPNQVTQWKAMLGIAD